MSRHLLSALIAALIALVWIGFLQYRKLNDRLTSFTERLADVEAQSADGRDEEGADAELRQRIEELESKISGLQEISGLQGSVDSDKAASGAGHAPATAKPITVRKFTNQASGKSVEARLTAVNGPDVTIRRIDGKEFTFPIARLTRADQIYIAEHADSLEAEPDSRMNSATDLNDADFRSLFD